MHDVDLMTAVPAAPQSVQDAAWLASPLHLLKDDEDEDKDDKDGEDGKGSKDDDERAGEAAPRPAGTSSSSTVALLYP